MKQSAYEFPREISPEMVEIGDTVQVHHKRERGMQMTLTGTVDNRVDSGNTRYMRTAEGATLFAWCASGNKKIRIVLLHREAKPQEELELFASHPELDKRLAG